MKKKPRWNKTYNVKPVLIRVSVGLAYPNPNSQEVLLPHHRMGHQFITRLPMTKLPPPPQPTCSCTLPPSPHPQGKSKGREFLQHLTQIAFQANNNQAFLTIHQYLFLRTQKNEPARSWTQTSVPLAQVINHQATTSHTVPHD